jgi:hypothetical protein
MLISPGTPDSLSGSNSVTMIRVTAVAGEFGRSDQEDAAVE